MRQGGEQATSLWMCNVSLHKFYKWLRHLIHFRPSFVVIHALAPIFAYALHHVSVYLIPHIHLPDPPEYANTAPVQFTQLMVGAPFTLNCTPSAANPPVDTVSTEVDGSPVTSGDTVTVTGNVLTIPSVQRSHSGNYSCTATNTRGSAIVYHNLLVVGVLMQ